LVIYFIIYIFFFFYFFFFLMFRRSPISTLFPYTTLFRSNFEPGLVRRPFIVDRIKMPVDLVSEIEMLITEQPEAMPADIRSLGEDRKSTRLNSSHVAISYAVFCLKKKN